LPSLALFQWALAGRQLSEAKLPLVLTLADYNPSVLFLVTLPNFILAWAIQQRGENPILDGAFSPDGEMELELTSGVLQAFKDTLSSNQISLLFLSGAWSPEFVQLLSSSVPSPLADTVGEVSTLVMGAETIYSPFALESFAATLLAILEQDRRSHPGDQSTAIIAAKRLYFGVGGSLDDFVDKMKSLGANVETLREETQGVRRGVVRCRLP
jgi:protein-histidine N-methyltransferase